MEHGTHARDEVIQEIDALLHYLSPLSTQGQEFLLGWGGDTVQMPCPIYADDVEAFFRAAGRPFWRDYGYDPLAARTMLANDERIAGASLSEIKTMLTYCVRGERFSPGLWNTVLTSGRVQALLRRLAVLREDLSRTSDA